MLRFVIIYQSISLNLVLGYDVCFKYCLVLSYLNSSTCSKFYLRLTRKYNLLQVEEFRVTPNNTV